MLFCFKWCFARYPMHLSKASENCDACCDRSGCITVHFKCCPFFFNSARTVKVSLQIVSQVAFETPREEPKDLRVVSISFLFHRHHSLSFKSSAYQKKNKSTTETRDEITSVRLNQNPASDSVSAQCNLPYEYLQCKYNGDEQSAST